MRQRKNDDLYGGKDGDAGSGERGTRGNQAAREQPRQRSRRTCWTCGGVGWGPRARQGEAGRDVSSEGDERGMDNQF